VIPNGLPISLLGQSFLKQVPDVAIQGDMMVLSN
jgi:predicted aspartyl protease